MSPRYQPVHRSFVNRLFQALFAYAPKSYSGNVVVYEANVKPLLYLPQIGRIWQQYARQAEIVEIVGTHIGMMHEPYVDALADDMLQTNRRLLLREPLIRPTDASMGRLRIATQPIFSWARFSRCSGCTRNIQQQTGRLTLIALLRRARSPQNTCAIPSAASAPAPGTLCRQPRADAV